MQKLFDENRVIQGDYNLDNFPISTVISSWGVHYRSWNNVKKNYLLIKYENLVKNPYKEFKKMHATPCLPNESSLRFLTCDPNIES